MDLSAEDSDGKSRNWASEVLVIDEVRLPDCMWAQDQRSNHRYYV